MIKIVSSKIYISRPEMMLFGRMGILLASKKTKKKAKTMTFYDLRYTMLFG